MSVYYVEKKRLLTQNWVNLAVEDGLNSVEEAFIEL